MVKVYPQLAECELYNAHRDGQKNVDYTNIEMHNIEQAMDAYKIRFGSYPSTEEGLGLLVTKEVMREMPFDMWGRQFEYVRHSAKSYSLKSLGADGAPGGDGFDKDLVLR